jgi:hypothetical protein
MELSSPLVLTVKHLPGEPCDVFIAFMVLNGLVLKLKYQANLLLFLLQV